MIVVCLVTEPVRVTTEPVVVSKLVDATNSCQGMILVIDEFGCSSLDVRSRYGVDAAKDFCRCHAAPIGQQLSANVFCNVGVSIQSHEHGGLEVELCALDLFIGWGVDKADQVVHQGPHAVIDLNIGADHVDAK